jgi:hypothetical protein
MFPFSIPDYLVMRCPSMRHTVLFLFFSLSAVFNERFILGDNNENPLDRCSASQTQLLCVWSGDRQKEIMLSNLAVNEAMVI